MQTGRNVRTFSRQYCDLDSGVAGVGRPIRRFDSLLGRNRFLQHGGFFISLQAKTILALLLQTDGAQPLSAQPRPLHDRCLKSRDATCLFEDDVNVAGNKLGDLLPLCGLHGVVALLVLSEILSRARKWGLGGVRKIIFMIRQTCL